MSVTRVPVAPVEAQPAPASGAPSMRRLLWAGALLVAIPPLVVYGLTLEPTLYFVDSGIILATVKVFGIAYSPGFPLYIILAKLWTLLAGVVLPFMSFTQSVNYVAGLAAAVAAVFIYLTVFQLLSVRAIEPQRAESGGAAAQPVQREHPRGNGRRDQRRGAPRANTAAAGRARQPVRRERAPTAALWRFEPGGPAERRIAFAAAVMAGWLTAFAYTVWSQAINADMYTLLGACDAAVLYLVVRLWQTGPVVGKATPTQRRLVLGMMAAYGCAWGVHYLSVGLVPFMLFMIWRYRGLLRDGRLVLLSAAVFLACGALPYVYEPIRSAMWPEVDWGHVATVGNLFQGLTGSTWTTNSSNFRVFDWQQFVQALGHWLHVTVFQFFPLTLAAILIGCYGLWRRYRPLVVPLALFYVGAVAIAISYVTNNGESYLIPAHITLALVAGVGVAYGARLIANGLRRWIQALQGDAARLALVSVVGLVLAGTTVAVNYPHMDRHNNYVEQEYGENAFSSVPRNGIMLIPGDSLNSAALYLQVVRGYRRDIAVIPESVVHNDWWRASFRHHHPGFYLPEIPAGSVGSDQQWMTDLIGGLIAHNPGRTVYLLTLKGKGIPAGYTAVPAGIGYRIVANTDTANLRVRRSDWNFSFQGLRQALQMPQDLQQAYNVFAREVQLAYVQAFQNLGDAEFDQQHYALAAQDYTTALEFYPTNPDLRLALGASLAMSGHAQQAISYLPPSSRSMLNAVQHPSTRDIRAAFAPALNGIGLGYYAGGIYERALQAFKMADALDPTYPDALIDLGAVLYQQGRPREALVYLLRGTRVAPRNAKIYYNLGQVYAKLGDRLLSQRMFDRAFALDPSLRPSAP